MKESVKQGFDNILLSKSDISLAAVRHIIMAIVGFASTKASVKGLMLPFGLALASGIGRVYFPSVATGVFLGYFFPIIGNSGFRYIAAFFAITAIKTMTFPYKKISTNPLFLSLIALLASGITNTLTLSGSAKDTALFFCESFLAAGSAYFVSLASKGIERSKSGLTANEMASLLITISIVVTGLSTVTIYGISAGRILGIVLILLASKYGGTLSGSVSGIALSISCLISGNNTDISVAYSLSGLTAGIFSAFGRFAQSGALIISFLICKTITGFDSSFYATLAEAVIGSAIYILIPRSFGATLGKTFSMSSKINDNKNVKNGINIRLNMAANALKEVSKTTESVSKELAKINTPNFTAMFSKIKKDTCNGCNNLSLCWETKRPFTTYAIKDITKGFNNAKPSNEDNLTDLKGRCYRFSKLYESTKNRYGEYTNSLISESRITEVRDVVCSQLSGISDMLFDLSRDFENDENYNYSIADSVSSALKNLEIISEETFAKTDRFGRTTVMVKVKNTPELIINKRQVMKLCSLATDLKFDIPSVNTSSDYTYITLSEHTAYKTEIGAYAIPAKNGQISGDAYNYFNDGLGHTVMILSDGMGSGGRAAVDGAMASNLMSELIKAGFGYSCALKLINSSMLFKSSDESLATLDIARIDLYTGETVLFKAGAAPTVIRRNGACGKAESTSLPIGILSNVGFDTATIKLKEKDIVLLTSDGAISEGSEWIKEELEAFKDGTAQDLAERICCIARKKQDENKRDDITVMAAIIDKAI